MSGDVPWWRYAVVYEAYVRSFADADGDGLGDLAGLRSRLPYVASLGVDAIWLTPFYPSGDHDQGYDVIDHRAVDPRLGTLDELDGLIADAHAIGLRVVLDVVANHVAVEHPWFKAARTAGRGSPERARFHVRPGRGASGSEPPTNWQSIFGGSAWEPLGDGEWYLHLFDVGQPDLDHRHPDVAKDLEETVRFWLDRGVDGLRFDAAGAMAKDPDYPDLPAGWLPGDPSPFSDLEAVHHVHRRLARMLDSYGPERLGVAEVWGPAALTGSYVRPDELGQAFAIEVMFAPLEAEAVRTQVDAYLAAAAPHGRLPGWVHGCHDVARAATRWGEDGAAAVLLLLLALPGAVYLFAGDELGLPEVCVPDEAIQDPTFRRSGGVDRGRDGCRVPLPWAGTVQPYGFGPPGAVPWLPQPTSWADRSVERQEIEPASPLRATRAALAARRSIWLGQAPTVAWLPVPDGCLAFHRSGHAACLMNLSTNPVPWTSVGREVLLSSAPVRGDLLPPRATAWLGLTGHDPRPGAVPAQVKEPLGRFPR